MTYELIKRMSGTGIKCLRCGQTSFNQNDVANRYCNRCAFFHDEDSKPDDENDWLGNAVEAAALESIIDQAGQEYVDSTTTTPEPSFGGGESGGGGASGDFS